MGAMIVIVYLQQQRVRKIQEELFRQANYDVLTGLPNRQYLMNYLSCNIEMSMKKQTSFAFLLIDIDNFKLVNDSVGHDAGDELLRHIAEYLNGVHDNTKLFYPSSGALNLSVRIGGDEFVQIIPGISTVYQAHEVAKKVLENFESQILNEYIEKYRVGLSIGVALFPLHSTDANVLFKYADLAMYTAKKNGKNNYSIYKDKMQAEFECPDDINSKVKKDRRTIRRDK
jgi:diguanylate cyclase (GGDEF)-like protein